MFTSSFSISVLCVFIIVHVVSFWGYLPPHWVTLVMCGCCVFIGAKGIKVEARNKRVLGRSYVNETIGKLDLMRFGQLLIVTVYIIGGFYAYQGAAGTIKFKDGRYYLKVAQAPHGSSYVEISKEDYEARAPALYRGNTILFFGFGLYGFLIAHFGNLIEEDEEQRKIRG